MASLTASNNLQKRRRPITYGKLAKKGGFTLSTPPTTPRAEAASSASSHAASPGNRTNATESMSIFDVPSGDDLQPSKTPVKKLKPLLADRKRDEAPFDSDPSEKREAKRVKPSPTHQTKKTLTEKTRTKGAQRNARAKTQSPIRSQIAHTQNTRSTDMWDVPSSDDEGRPTKQLKKPRRSPMRGLQVQSRSRARSQTPHRRAPTAAAAKGRSEWDVPSSDEDVLSRKTDFKTTQPLPKREMRQPTPPSKPTTKRLTRKVGLASEMLESRRGTASPPKAKTSKLVHALPIRPQEEAKAEIRRVRGVLIPTSSQKPAPNKSIGKLRSRRGMSTDPDSSDLDHLAEGQLLREAANPTGGDVLSATGLSPEGSVEGGSHTSTPQKATCSVTASVRTPTGRFYASASPDVMDQGDSVTPRQNQLWSKLLDSPNGVESPNQLPIKNLSIQDSSSKRQPRKRSRLIDALSQQSSRSAAAGEADGELTSDDRDSSILSENSNAMDVDTASDPPVSSHESSTTTTAGVPRLTYSQQQRSYLSEEKLEDELMFDLPSVTPVKASQPTVHDPDEPEASHGMRSIHELRAGGSHRRFVDEMEGILDTLEDTTFNSMSAKRSAMMELASKLLDKATVTRFIDAGLERRLFSRANNTSDTVLAFAQAATIAFVAESDPSLATLQLMHRSSMLQNLVLLLDTDLSINRVVKQRVSNMSKVAQASCLEFQDLIRTSTIWSSSPPDAIKPRLLALKALDSLVCKIRGHGDKDDILDDNIINKVTEIASATAGATSPGEATRELELSVCLLESASVNPGELLAHFYASETPISTIVDIITYVLKLSTEGKTEVEFKALQLCLQLANNRPKVCDAFSKTSFIQLLLTTINKRFEILALGPGHEEWVTALQGVVFSLGAMINLTEFSDPVRQQVLSTGSTALRTLTSTFLEGQKKAAEAESVEQTSANVAYGYLAVLLGNLCDNARVREEIRSRLPGGNLEILIGAIEEFIQFHTEVDLEGKVGETAGVSTFTERLQKVVQRLRIAAMQARE